MKLSPVDIESHGFKVVWRGYDPDEVRAFMGQISHELTALLRERQSLVEQSKTQFDRLSQVDDYEARLRDVMLSANKLAEASREDAQREAELIIKEGEIRADQILSEGRSELRRVQEEVHLLKRQKERFLIEIRALVESHLRMLQNHEGAHLESRGDSIRSSEPHERGSATPDRTPQSTELWGDEPLHALNSYDPSRNTHEGYHPHGISPQVKQNDAIEQAQELTLALSSDLLSGTAPPLHVSPNYDESALKTPPVSQQMPPSSDLGKGQRPPVKPQLYSSTEIRPITPPPLANQGHKNSGDALMTESINESGAESADAQLSQSAVDPRRASSSDQRDHSGITQLQQILSKTPPRVSHLKINTRAPEVLPPPSIDDD
jgi:cell division initiation protein